jgi:hypothetical protein
MIFYQRALANMNQKEKNYFPSNPSPEIEKFPKIKNKEKDIFSDDKEKTNIFQKFSHGLIHLTKKINKEFHNKNFDLLSLPFLNAIKKISQKSSETLKKINFFAKNLENKQENKVWNHDFLLKRLANNHELNYTKEELTNNILENDWETFLDEYIFAKSHTEYEFSKTGLPNGYKENLTDLSKSLDFQKNKRFFIEGENMKAVQNFIESEEFAPNEKLIWFSPKGKAEDGYLGEKDTSYNFVFIYEKQDDQKTKLNIYRNYDDLKKLSEIKEEVSSFGEINPTINKNEVNLNQSEKMISELIRIKETTNLESLENLIFQNEDNWSIKKTDLPNLSEDEIKNLGPALNKSKKFYFDKFKEIAQEIPENLDLNNNFFQSRKYQNIIKNLDLAFTLSHQSLLKIIDNHQKNQDLNLNLDQDLKTIFASMTNQKTIEKKDFKNVKNLLNTNLISVTNPLTKILSVGQCGIGSFIPTGLIKNFSALNSFKTINFKNVSYLIPKEYFTGKGVYEKNGKLYGPCDILLKNDPLVRILDSSPITSNSNMPKKNQLKPNSSKNNSDLSKKENPFFFKPSVTLEQFVVGDFYST